MPLEVFTQRNFLANLFDWNWILFKTKTKNRFWTTFWGLRGNVRSPSIESPWSTSHLSYRTFFTISYGWDVISGNLSKSALFEGEWVTFSANFRRKGASPTNHC